MSNGGIWQVSTKKSSPRPSASRGRDKEKEKAKEKEREKEDDENNNDDPIQKLVPYSWDTVLYNGQ